MDMTTTSATAAPDKAMPMDMSGMAMVFFSAFSTPLFATAWTPSTRAQYAATCAFLVALGALLRGLIALRSVVEARIWRQDDDGRHAVQPVPDEQESLYGKTASRSVGQNRWSGWRFAAAGASATYELVLIGVGYLLMLAVMTMNVGYFLSVLAGAWAGTFVAAVVLGAVSRGDDWEHC